MNYSDNEKIVIPVMFFGLLIIAVVLAVLLKNKSEKARNIPFAFILDCNYVNILSNPELALLENFRLTYGQITYDLVWLMLGTLLSCLPILLLWSIDKIKSKKKRLKS